MCWRQSGRTDGRNDLDCSTLGMHVWWRRWGSFECVSFGASALARLDERCWEAVEAHKGDWLRPFAALLLAAPPQQHFEVCGAPCKWAPFAHANGTEVSTGQLANPAQGKDAVGGDQTISAMLS